MGEKITQSFRTSLSLQTLADDTGLLADTLVDGSRLNGVQIQKMWAALSFINHTANEGSILWGFSRNVGTVTQLKEWLEADPQGPSNTAEVKKTESDIYVMGWLPETDKVSYGSGLRMIRFPWKKLGEDDTLSIWAFNDSGASLTTGTIVKVQIVISGHWMDD